MRALVVHGGAGRTPAEADDPQGRACDAALELGWEILVHGGDALDAVTRAVAHLEDDPALNAGYGASLTDAGTVELDASIMEGTERRAGAVALVTRLRNPVLLARALLDENRHVLMAGPAAEELAASRGLALVAPDALIAPARRRAWEERVAAAARTGDAPDDAEHRGAVTTRDPATSDDDEHGTVGAVALDQHGRVAAATSTGGIAWKRRGRIGDSAVIGAGTYADDGAGAVSATGLGEAIIRAGVARVLVEDLRSGVGPTSAAERALAIVTAVGGDGGVIVVDRFGRVAAVHTTPHMTFRSRRG